MPTYTYSCLDCKHKWEELLPVAQRDNPIEMPCPECEGFNITRGVGCAGFVLKGFCWSKDNYSRTIGDDPRGVEDTNWDLNNA